MCFWSLRLLLDFTFVSQVLLHRETNRSKASHIFSQSEIRGGTFPCVIFRYIYLQCFPPLLSCRYRAATLTIPAVVTSLPPLSSFESQGVLSSSHCLPVPPIPPPILYRPSNHSFPTFLPSLPALLPLSGPAFFSSSERVSFESDGIEVEGAVGSSPAVASGKESPCVENSSPSPAGHPHGSYVPTK